MAPRWAVQLDAFRGVPKDLAEASAHGAIMTFVAVITCSLLFFCETVAFLSDKPRTDVVLDSNKDADLRINFDVTMMDMSCDYVTLGVWDAFGSERMNITRNIAKQRVDHRGVEKGHFYTEDELVELDLGERLYTAEERAELDSDWTSSSDAFHHDDFSAVVNSHDATMLYFYADWCPHCQAFLPIWETFEKSVNTGEEVIADADGGPANVKALKINCVDFQEACQEQRINSFPSVRLYKKGQVGKWVDYWGSRELHALVSFTKDEVKKSHLHMGATYHSIFTEGCRVRGHVDVARVPGTLYFQAMHPKEKSLNLAYTNVSHVIHHFSFGEWTSQKLSQLPWEYRENAAPVDGHTFAVDKFHMAPQHFIKVVHTRWASSKVRSYQQTHQWSVRTLPRDKVPQANFSYDLSPVEVVIKMGDRRWYDYMTSVFAIIGGTFTIMSMTAGFLGFTSAQFKATINKLG